MIYFFKVAVEEKVRSSDPVALRIVNEYAKFSLAPTIIMSNNTIYINVCCLIEKLIIGYQPHLM